MDLVGVWCGSIGGGKYETWCFEANGNGTIIGNWSSERICFQWQHIQSQEIEFKITSQHNDENNEKDHPPGQILYPNFVKFRYVITDNQLISLTKSGKPNRLFIMSMNPLVKVDQSPQKYSCVI